jgi:hypothetical protein
MDWEWELILWWKFWLKHYGVVYHNCCFLMYVELENPILFNS